MSTRPPRAQNSNAGSAIIAFDDLLLKDFLQDDPRPTFVLDLAAVNGRDVKTSGIVFANPPLKSSQCYHALVNHSENKDYGFAQNTADFWSWATGQDTTGHYTFCGEWTSITTRSRWRTISNRNCTTNDHQSPDIAQKKRKTTNSVLAANDQQLVADTSVARTAHELTKVDVEKQPSEAYGTEWKWIVLDLLAGTNPFFDFLRNLDWAQTGFGPISTWTPQFQILINMLLLDPRPTSLVWGPDRLMFYNLPYLEIVGERHPAGFGLPFAQLFPEIADFLDNFLLLERTRSSITGEDSELHLVRNGLAEECYFTFSLIPIFAGEKITGIYNTAFETTRQKIAERRMGTLIRLGESLAANRDMAQFWSRTVQALRLYEHDFPLVSVYSIALSGVESQSGRSSGMYPTLALEGRIGFPDGHPAARGTIDLSRGYDGFEEQFRVASRSGEVIVLNSADGTLPESLIQGIRCGRFQEPCRCLVILPIKHQGGVENIGGFIVLGLNPRRPFNQDYHDFFGLLINLLGASMAATVLFEEEIRRGQDAANRAALEQEELERQLARTTLEAKRLGMQFTHFADQAPIGINIFKPDGKVLYANSIWYDMTMYDRRDENEVGWMREVFKGEGPELQGVWHALLVEKRSVTVECRMKKPWKPPGGGLDDRKPFSWILASVFPEINPMDGTVDAMIGCFVDITQHKWAEELQTQRMNEAIEGKKTLEKFIDMTSHEMRNPLSAIIHCCDGIIDALAPEDDAAADSTQVSQEAVATSLDAARTILHCSVDDILVLSKLESDLLPIAPANVKIEEVIEEIISMFRVELKSAGIALHREVHESFERLKVDRVFVDPSRLAQVLINLMTNAIKFTQSEQRRQISVRIAAITERPVASTYGVRYVPRKLDEQPDEVTSGIEWGLSEVIFLQFAISDTGRGMKPLELENLFRRFSQGSPRTHIQYGGSGLGLYIARELTEKQGGAIGVSSQAGQGSTFAFYVEARRAPNLQPPKTLSTRRKSTQITVPQLPTTADAVVPPIIASTAHPAALPKAPSNGYVPQATSTTTRPSTPASGHIPAKFPILIVEDNIVNRTVLKRQLTRLGYPIHEANHGEEALAFLRTSKFWRAHPDPASAADVAVVLMDQEMPVMDGLTCMRRIRELEASGEIVGHVPTIAVTANARQEQIDIALATGMDKVLCKPFRIPELVEQMKVLALEQGLSGDAPS